MSDATENKNKMLKRKQQKKKQKNRGDATFPRGKK